MIPQATDIERLLLGTFLIDKGSLHVVEDLSADDFYNDWNKVVFKAIGTLHSQSKPVDILTIQDYLKERGEPEDLQNYAIDLSRDATPRYEEYSELLKDKTIKRRMQTLGLELQERSISDESGYSLIDHTEKTIDNLSGFSGIRSATPTEIMEREENAPKRQKIFTGYSKLDNGIYADSGAYKGHVELTLAESGHGKTEYALFINGLRAHKGYKVHWFQLEDYDVNTAKHFMLNYPEQADNVIICDSIDDIEGIKREARSVKKSFGTDVIVVDYVQNVECASKFQSEKVEYVSKELRKLAKNLNVVVHELSQVTITDDRRKGWKLEPNYNDVRWSKQLKQDAHLMTSVFRPNKVDDLIITSGISNKVLDWNEQSQPFDSVYVRTVKVRGGKQEYARLHLIHGDLGLKPYHP